MKEYEQKIYNIIGNAREEVIFQTNQAYKNGYMDGMKEKLANAMIYDHEEAEKKAYNRGLDEAWEVIKKITKDDSVGGYSLEMMQNLFSHTCVYDIVHNYTASEAIAKIRAYEDKQKQDAEIKVGDEVVFEDAHVVITYISPSNEWNGFLLNDCESGKRGHGYTLMKGFNGWKKTGRHFPQIAEVLKEMRGAENDE